MVKQVKPYEHKEEEKKERISYPHSEGPNRKSASGENYVKVFSFSIVLLILGIIIASMSSLIVVFADPQSSQEAQDLAKSIVVVGTVSTIFLQLGMVVFSLSTFLGAVRGETLSGDVRKGMAAASAIGILALGVMMITIVNFPYYY